MEEISNARQQISLFDCDSMNCGLVKDRLFLGKHMAKRFYQLRARFEDRLKVFRAQSQEQARADGRASLPRCRTGQKRYFTKGVAGSDPSAITPEVATIPWSGNAKTKPEMASAEQT